MKMSTHGRYGLRAILRIATAYGNGPMDLKTIARHEEVSPKYLHAILTSLKTAGLVHTVRGVKGGYELAREPSQINLLEVVRTLEGSLGLVECVEDESICRRVGDCITHKLWSRMSALLEQHLERISLADMVRGDPFVCLEI